MKFPDLVTFLGASNPKNVRAVIVKLELPIAANARTIPDEYIDVIKEQYDIDFAPLFRRSVSADTPGATTKDIFSISSTAIDISKEEEVAKKVAEKKAKAVKEVKAKEKAKAEAEAAKKGPEPKKISTLSTENVDIDIDDIEVELDLEEDKSLPELPNQEEELVFDEEKIERVLEKERRKSDKKIKAHDDDDDTDDEDLEEDGHSRKKEKQEKVWVAKQNVTLPEVISIKEFSEKIGIPPAKIIAELLKNGIFVTINHKIDFDTAMLVSDSFQIAVTKEETVFTTKDLLQGNLSKLLENEDPSTLETRPPVVSIMGHVDHGKTSLLDYIRKSKVTASEAGGITQHIGAYQVEVNGQKITFLDTPGHEAFTAMRARGAKATDIAILVVAADEGVKPQTQEAINHAKDAGIPIIVALNKIDKEGANLDRVKAELAEHGLVPEDWGGDVIMLPLSALTGQGVDTLLEMILLSCEMLQLKAAPGRSAIGTIIESRLDPSLGPIATVLVNTGTLKQGDVVTVGETYGRIKTMHDAAGKQQKEAAPSCPVRVSGFVEVPQAGDILQVVKDEKAARELASEMIALRTLHGNGGKLSFSDLVARINQGELKQLKVVLKADTKGSLEALRTSLLKLNTDEVQMLIIHSGIGNITETDVLMASAADGMILGFHVDTPPQVNKSAEKYGVAIKTYRVIYHMTEEMKKLLGGMLDPEIKEVILGDITVLRIFFTGKKFYIIGGKVTKGRVEVKGKVRVIRGDKLIGEGVIETLQKGETPVHDIGEGHECGMKFVSPITPEEGDIFEVYKIEKIERTLS